MTAPAKSTSAKTASSKIEEKPEAVKPSESTDAVENKDRIPASLAANPILADFCRQYLEAVDEINKYNEAVLAEKSSEWNVPKVMERARTFARPTDPNSKPHTEILKALTEVDELSSKLISARKVVLDLTSKELGITLSATAERNAEQEAPLKEKRKFANEIGTQLTVIARMTSDADAADNVTKFLDANPLPAVGRDQVKSFGEENKAAPKYRTKVTVSKDGNVLLEEDGFTKTALALTKPVFNYERGKALKSTDLRAAWEKVGNTPEKTVQATVEFDDNGLHYVITKK